MTDPIRHALFLCTGNSARSILAEAILNHAGEGRIRAHSAGSDPKDSPHPQALALLARKDHPTADLRSKSWDEFAHPGAPRMDFIFTVCDSAANEPCPLWPGQPITAHWGLPDPAAATGSESDIARAFEDTYEALQTRIAAFLGLPQAAADPQDLHSALQDIHISEDTHRT